MVVERSLVICISSFLEVRVKERGNVILVTFLNEKTIFEHILNFDDTLFHLDLLWTHVSISTRLWVIWTANFDFRQVTAQFEQILM